MSFQTIIEETSPLATSKSSSSRKDLIFGGTSNDDFKITRDQNYITTEDDILKKSSTNSDMQNRLNQIN